MCGALAERARESLGDLPSGFVGEREGAEPIGAELQLLDEIPNALDEAERLPRPGSGEHKEGRGLRLDRLAL
jgi:hypothetical protein